MIISPSIWVSFLAALAALATPSDDMDAQLVFDALASESYSDVLHELGNAAHNVADTVANGRKNVLDSAKKLAIEAEQTIERYVKDGAMRQFINQHGTSCKSYPV